MARGEETSAEPALAARARQTPLHDGEYSSRAVSWPIWLHFDVFWDK